MKPYLVARFAADNCQLTGRKIWRKGQYSVANFYVLFAPESSLKQGPAGNKTNGKVLTMAGGLPSKKHSAPQGDSIE